MKNLIRILVADDSPTVREILITLFHAAPGMQVVGQAHDGQEAVHLARRLRPDVITMDIRMPHMDGLEATRLIMRTIPTPIVIVANRVYERDLNIAFNAIAAGALTVVEKPYGMTTGDDQSMCDEIVTTVRLMADVPVIHHWPNATRSAAHVSSGTPPSTTQLMSRRTVKVIGLASSTGGPAALATILRSLPAKFPLPIVIVQHMTNGFLNGLADWLSQQTSQPVRIASHGASLRQAAIWLAPEDYHLQIDKHGGLVLSRELAYKGLRPSANYLFHSLAEVYGSQAAGVILTGMGDDGADGLVALHAAGGLTIAQDEASCVVYGMPREAVSRQAIDQVLPLEQVAAALGQLAGL